MPKLSLAALVLPRLAVAQVYLAATFDVKTTQDVTYAQGLSCPDDQFSASGCEIVDIKLDVLEPVQKSGGPAVPTTKPAYVLMHGGGNKGGTKGNNVFKNAADWWASRGFVVFDINYRLRDDKGLLPKEAVQKQVLVTHSKNDGSKALFLPSPSSNSSGDPYTGPLKLVTDIEACMSVDGKSVILEECVSGSSIQQWHMAEFLNRKQTITHVATGFCLSIPSATEEAADGLPLEVAPCDSHMDANSTQMWQHGGQTSRGLSVRAKSVNGSWPGPYAMFAKPQPATSLKWSPQWFSAYPAIRDGKAAIRWVRANANTYGVDTSRIAASGGSAGASDMLAVGVTFEEDYKNELTVDQDPTLSTTNLNFSSAVQCLVLHWASDGGITLTKEHNPQRGERYRISNPPIVSFHGDADTTIPIERAYTVQSAYKGNGIPYHLHVLSGCGHAAWCYDGNGTCDCNGAAWTADMEELAFPDVVKHLDLEVVDEGTVV